MKLPSKRAHGEVRAFYELFDGKNERYSEEFLIDVKKKKIVAGFGGYNIPKWAKDKAESDDNFMLVHFMSMKNPAPYLSNPPIDFTKSKNWENVGKKPVHESMLSEGKLSKISTDKLVKAMKNLERVKGNHNAANQFKAIHAELKKRGHSMEESITESKSFSRVAKALDDLQKRMKDLASDYKKAKDTGEDTSKIVAKLKDYTKTKKRLEKEFNSSLTDLDKDAELVSEGELNEDANDTLYKQFEKELKTISSTTKALSSIESEWKKATSSSHPSTWKKDQPKLSSIVKRYEAELKRNESAKNTFVTFKQMIDAEPMFKKFKKYTVLKEFNSSLTELV